MSKIAISILSPLSQLILCEITFSALTDIKSKYRSKLNVESDFRIAVLNIKLDTEMMNFNI